MAFPVSGEPVVAEFAQFEIVSTKRVSRTVFEYVVKPAVVGDEVSRTNWLLSVFSDTPATEIVDGSGAFPSLPAQAQVLSEDTLTIRHDRAVAFDPGQLEYLLDETFAVDPLTFTVDPANTVSGDFTTSDVTLDLTDAGGVSYALSATNDPSDEVASISMAEVTSIADLPPGFTPVAAVSLGPDGAEFANLVTIDFEFATDPRGGLPAVGFVTNGDGSGLRLVPLQGSSVANAALSDLTVSLQTASFSKAGVATVSGGGELSGGTKTNAGARTARQRARDTIVRRLVEIIEMELLDEVAAGGGFLADPVIAEAMRRWKKDLDRRITVARQPERPLRNVRTLKSLTKEVLHFEADRQILGAGGVENIDLAISLNRDAIDAQYTTCFAQPEETIVALLNHVADAQSLGDESLGDPLTIAQCRFRVEVEPAQQVLVAPGPATFDTELRVVGRDNSLEYPEIEAPVTAIPGGLNPVVASGSDFAAEDTTVRFTPQPGQVGLLRLQGQNLRSAVEVEAWVLPALSGTYSGAGSTIRSGCDDPEDAGSFGLPLDMNLTAMVTPPSAPGAPIKVRLVGGTGLVQQGDDSGRANLQLDFTIPTTPPEPETARLVGSGSGSINYITTETDLEFDPDLGQDVEVTYVTGGGGTITAAEIAITPGSVEISYSFRGGDNFCSASRGNYTLTK